MTDATVGGWWAEQSERFRLDDFDLEFAAEVTSQSTGAITLSLTPSISMSATGTSVAAMDLAITPSISFVGLAYVDTISLSLTPSIDMSATATSTGEFTISLTPTIGMAGGEHYISAFDVVLTPTFAASAYVKQIPHPIPWTI